MPSSVIRSWSYDPDDRRLDVTFVSGRRYAYRDVPPEVAQDMKLAFSKGEFFNRRIRGRYAYELSRSGEAGGPPATPPRPDA
jgi:lysyl-tRNA synthetase class 2